MALNNNCLLTSNSAGKNLPLGKVTQICNTRLGRLKQEDFEFKVGLCNMASLKKRKRKKAIPSFWSSLYPFIRTPTLHESNIGEY